MKRKYYVYIALVLTVLILNSFVSTLVYIFLSLVTVFGIAYNEYTERNKANAAKAKVPTEPEINDDGKTMDWQSEVSSEEAYRYLMQSNYKLRVDGNSLRPEDVTEIENLIDDLRNLVLLVENSTSVLKWKVNQICVDFIPKLINRFNSATSESRTDIMNTTVSEIRSRLSEIESVVNNNNQQEFEHYASTLQKIMKA